MAAIAPPLAIILALAVVSILQSGAGTDTSKAGLFPMALFLNARAFSTGSTGSGGLVL
jgi:hypothetical protein